MDVVWGLVSLSALTQGSVWNANPLQMGTQTTMSCAHAEDSGLLGPLQSPNWVKVCLISTVVFLPVSVVLTVKKCLGLSVGDRSLCLRSPTANFANRLNKEEETQDRQHIPRQSFTVFWRGDQARTNPTPHPTPLQKKRPHKNKIRKQKKGNDKTK